MEETITEKLIPISNEQKKVLTNEEVAAQRHYFPVDPMNAIRIPLEYLQEKIDHDHGQTTEHYVEQGAIDSIVRGRTELGVEKILKRRKYLENKIEKRIGKKAILFTDKLMELAEGIYMEQIVADENGVSSKKVYQKPPNKDVLIYLLDRVLGKPTVRKEIDVKEEKRGLILVQNIIQDLAKSNGTKPNASIQKEKRTSNEFVS